MPQPKTPWHNYGLIAHIARRVGGKTLGKTKLQKLIYFMRQAKKIPLDYSYRFHTYGPYCDELSGDVDYLEAVKALDIDFNTTLGYVISPGERAQWLEEKAKYFLSSHQKAIDNVLDHFSAKNAHKLELLSSILYLASNGKDHPSGPQAIIARVRERKPHFNEEEIRAGIQEMENLGYL